MKLSILNYKHYFLLCGGLLSFAGNVFAADKANFMNANSDECWEQLECIRKAHQNDALFMAAVERKFPSNLEVLDLARMFCDPSQAPVAQLAAAYAGPGRQANVGGNVKKGAGLTNEERLQLALALSATEEEEVQQKKAGYGDKRYDPHSLYSNGYAGNPHGSAAYAGPGRQANGGGYSVNERVPFNGVEARSHFDRENLEPINVESHRRNLRQNNAVSVRRDQGKALNQQSARRARPAADEMSFMYNFIFFLIGNKTSEKDSVKLISDTFPDDQEKQKKAVALYKDAKSDEEKNLDPKREGGGFTNKERGQASALLQDANNGGRTHEERYLRALIGVFSEERAKALYDAIINLHDSEDD